MVNYRHISIAGFLSGLTFCLLSVFDQSWLIAWTAGVTVLTAGLWMTEALPIPVTSLIPFVALPLGGVISHKTAASALGSPVIVLLMAAFILSKGISFETSPQKCKFLNSLFLLKAKY